MKMPGGGAEKSNYLSTKGTRVSGHRMTRIYLDPNPPSLGSLACLPLKEYFVARRYYLPFSPLLPSRVRQLE